MVTKGFSYYFEKVKCSSHNSYFLHQSCTETCTVVCGFWYLYRRICSNVISPPVFSFSLPYICYAGGLVNVYNNNSSALKIDCNKSCCLKNCFTNDCFWTRSNSITARCIVAKSCQHIFQWFVEKNRVTKTQKDNSTRFHYF